jgi:hypothetical protein
MGAAVGLKALKQIFAQMDREGRLAIARLAVDRTGTTALSATTAQAGEQTQAFKNLLHRHLLTQEGEVDLGAFARLRTLGLLDKRHDGRYGGRSRGDHFLGGTSRLWPTALLLPVSAVAASEAAGAVVAGT